MSYQIFKASDIGNRKGWVVDLSPPDIVNPDCYWFFQYRSQADRFLALVKSGYDPHTAAKGMVERWL